MVSEAERERLDAVQGRIDALRAARAPVRNPAAEKFTSASLAWRMVTELVVGVLLGAAVGWGLDTLVATKPLFLLIFGLLGFAAGIRTVMRSANEVRRRDAAAAPTTTSADPGAESRG
jgi:ATP synthase protein I